MLRAASVTSKPRMFGAYAITLRPTHVGESTAGSRVGRRPITFSSVERCAYSPSLGVDTPRAAMSGAASGTSPYDGVPSGVSAPPTRAYAPPTKPYQPLAVR